MSHEVETMMYIQETPWHGLGVYVGDQEVNSEEAIVAAGLDWSVKKQRLFTSPDGENVNEVNTHKCIVRKTDNKILGIVGNRYTPIQNVEAFQFMDSLVDDGAMKYHTAGSLRGGQKVWLLGKIGQTEVVPDDKVDQYLLLYNSHDGANALRIIFTTIRVVCANTAAWALGKAKGEGIYLMHTKNVLERAQRAREVLGLATQEFNNFNNFAKIAAGLRISDSDWRDMAKIIVPDPPKEKATDRIVKSREKIREDLTDLFYNGVGQDIPGVAGTGWAAYNAVTEYTNFFKRSRGNNKQERRFESTLFKGTVPMIDRTVQLIQKAA